MPLRIRIDTCRRVVQNCPDIPILDLIEWIDALYSIIEQLMEHKADPCSSTQLIQAQIIRVTVNDRAEFGCELGDDGQNNVAGVTVA